MIKRKIKNKKRKNPPLFYDEIESLLGQDIQVRIISNNGYLSLFGELKKTTIGIYYVQINEKNYKGSIAFNLNKIEKIFKNIIDLKSNEIIEESKFSEEKLMNELFQVFFK